jgi:hypothetical protein
MPLGLGLTFLPKAPKRKQQQQGKVENYTLNVKYAHLP